MSDWPRASLWIPLPVLNTIGAHFGMLEGIGANNSLAWPVNNKAYFYPFYLPEHVLVRQLLFHVGATSSGNIDMAIYDSEGNRIVSSGSTAMSATVNTVQELNIADTWLAPGHYFLAVACSTTVGTCFGSSNSADETKLPSYLVYEQTSALPLPDPATPVICTDSLVPRFALGIQLASVF